MDWNLAFIPALLIFVVSAIAGANIWVRSRAAQRGVGDALGHDQAVAGGRNRRDTRLRALNLTATNRRKGNDMCTASWRTLVRRTVVLAALAAGGTVVTVATATPAGAATNTAMHVRGTQTPVDEAQGLYRMHSAPNRTGLVGDWVYTSYTVVYQSPSFVVAEGTETFAGCVDTSRDDRCQAAEPAGNLYFDYTLWVRFNPVTGDFLGGRCVHPITGGDGGFAGASGLLTMRDVPVNGSVRTTYRGTVVLAAGTTTAARTTAGATAAARVSAVPARGC